MSNAVKSPLWTRLILALPLLFIVWSLGLIVSVNRLQAELSGKVALISRMNALTLSLRELDKGAAESAAGGDRQAALARWQARVGDYRRQAAAVSASDHPLVAPPLAALDAAVAKMEPLFRRPPSEATSDAERAAVENEVHKTVISTLDGVERAIQQIRQELSGHAVELAAKWRQLYLLVFISGLLAIIAVVLFNRLYRDLMKRRQAQEELKKERDFSNVVIETVGSLVIVLDREGRIVRFNRACEQLTGYSFAEVKGQIFWELFAAPEEIEPVKAAFAKLRAGEFPLTHFNHWQTKDGRLRLISWANTTLLDASGQPEYIIGTGLDVTDRRTAEAAAREGHNVLRAVVEGTPDAIFVKDLEGRYILVNTAAARFLGKPAEEILGKRDIELYSPETAQQFTEDDRKVISSGETQTFEGIATGPNITQMYLVTKSAYRNHQGQIIGLIGISHDITERKRAEEQRIALVREQQARMDAEQANRVKDEFLTTLSHELRTPLTAILGWSQLLNGGQLDESLRARALEVIERNARTQRQLIDDLLDISRIVAGKIRLDLVPTRLAPLIEAAMDSVRPVAAIKTIDLQLALDERDAMVQGDPVRLQQVIGNLLTNALKFTPEGGRIAVRLERTIESARITVTDTGQGISAEFLPYVFDRFSQADSSTTRDYSGLGLGLALVQYLVELQGGTVQVQSQGEGQGATFTINLPLIPLRRADEDSQRETESTPARFAEQSTAPLPPSVSLTGLRVLVVDDDVDSCEMLGLALRKCCVEVRLANSAAEALEVLGQWRPDLLISDIGMPEEDGFSLLQKVRALPPEHGGTVPAVALTAYATDFDRDSALAAGFQRHMGKPVELRELAEAIASLAGRTRTV